MTLEIKLKPDEKFVKSSEMIVVESNKKYSISTTVTGIKGVPYCGYFGLILFNAKEYEVARRIDWLNDFSGLEKTIEIVCNIPSNCKKIKLIYRINEEVPIKAECQYSLLPIENCVIKKLDIGRAEKYSFVKDYQLPKSLFLPKPRELSIEEEIILEKNIVWIFAAQRSGTQWLGTKLLTYNTNISQGPSIGLSLGSLHHETGFNEKMLRQIDFRGEDPDFFLSKYYKKTWQHYIRKLILNRLYAQFYDLSKKIIIPDPEGSMGADILSESVPNSKIIILIRDGRDVLDSLIDLLQPNSWYTKDGIADPINPTNRHTRIEWLIKRWNKLIEVLLKTYENHPHPNRILIRYEDLREDTYNTLKKIYDFINVNISKEELEHIINTYSFENIPIEEKGSGKVTRFAYPGKWKDDFSSDEKILINKLMGNTLQKLEYI